MQFAPNSVLYNAENHSWDVQSSINAQLSDYQVGNSQIISASHSVYFNAAVQTTPTIFTLGEVEMIGHIKSSEFTKFLRGTTFDNRQLAAYATRVLPMSQAEQLLLWTVTDHNDDEWRC